MNKTLGLCFVAQKMIIGTEKVLSKINKIKLFIISDDCSNNLLEKITNKSNFYKIDLIKINSNILSNSIGRENIKVIGIIDNGFKKIILEKKEDILWQNQI